MSVSEVLSRFIAGLSFEDLPPAVVQRIRHSVLDTLGCGLHGSATAWGRIVSDYVARTPGPCTIWADGRGSTAAFAALANATMVNGFELDDLHAPSRSHPGGVTVPVALALAREKGGIDGRSFIAAVAAGYETTARVGLCQGVSSFHRGWHPTGTAGVLGAAATASRLLGLTPGQTQHCLGIAGAMPAGLMAAQYGAMVKRLFSGHAAHVGVIAAQLAAMGFTGIPDLFDAEFGGYPRALSDEVDLGALTSGLGERYEIDNVGYKFYPCVGASHTAIDALKEILQTHDPAPDDVASIVVTTSDYQKVHAGWPYVPGNVMAAQMNMPFCLATLLLKRRVFVDEFSDESVRDPGILRWVERISVRSDPAQDAGDRTARVDVQLRNGKRLSATRRHATGHPSGPPVERELMTKFEALAGRALPRAALQRIVDLTDRLGELADVSIFDACLVPSQALVPGSRG